MSIYQYLRAAVKDSPDGPFPYMVYDEKGDKLFTVTGPVDLSEIPNAV